MTTETTNTPAAADMDSRGLAPDTRTVEQRAADLGAHLSRERGEPDGSAPAAPAAQVPAYLRSAYDAEVQAGRLTREQADKMMAQDAGIEPGAASTTQSDPMAAHLEQYGTPPAKAADFELPSGVFPADMSDKDAMAAGNGVREIMAAARLPKATGDFLARTVVELEPVWNGMDDTARELYKRESEARLKTIWKEAYAENLSLVRQLVNEIGKKHPAVRDLMDETGAGNNVAVLVKLAEHARILDQRVR